MSKREWTADEIERQKAQLRYWLTSVSLLALAAALPAREARS